MCVIMFINTIGRYTQTLSIPWAEEAARYLMIWLVFLASAWRPKRIPIFAVEVLFPLMSEGFHKYARPPNLLIVPRMVTSFDSFPFMAILFFILAGSMMQCGGIPSRLIAFIKMIMRKAPARLSAISTVGSGFFGAISGSNPATVAAVAKAKGIVIDYDSVETGWQVIRDTAPQPLFHASGGLSETTD